MCREVLFNNMRYPSSPSCPNKSRDWFCRPGRTRAVFTAVDTSGMFKLPDSGDERRSALGRATLVMGDYNVVNWSIEVCP